MTLPKLLFACMTKGVVLSAGKLGRIRFNPRSEVSPVMKEAIREHGDAIRALLQGEDVNDWRRVRLRKPDNPEITFIGGEAADPYDADPEMMERLALAEWERERESMECGDDPATYHPFVVPDDDNPPDDEDEPAFPSMF